MSRKRIVLSTPLVLLGLYGLTVLLYGLVILLLGPSVSSTTEYRMMTALGVLVMPVFLLIPYGTVWALRASRTNGDSH